MGRIYKTPGLPFLQLDMYPFLFFSLSLYYILPCSSPKHSLLHYFWLMFMYTAADHTPHRLNLTMSEGRLVNPLLQQEAKRREREKTETGLALMADNPVTNLCSSSKGWPSRLWLCDVNGTWRSGSVEAKREGFCFGQCLPQTCPLL